MNTFLIFLTVTYWGSMGFDARTISFMGGSSPVVGGAAAMFLNTGAIVSDDRFTAEFTYTNPFQLTDLAYGEAAAALSSNNFAVGLGFSSKFVKGIYSENTYMLGASVKGSLREGVSASAGVGLRYFRVSAKTTDMSHSSIFMLDFGSVLSAGMFRFSYVFQNLGYRGNDADYRRSLGVAITKSGLTAGFDYQWHRYFQTYSLFAEVVVLRVLALRVGYSNQNMGIGAGIVGNGYSVDIGMSGSDAGTTYSITFGMYR